MIYTGYQDEHLFSGMRVVVLPDDDERLKDLEPGCIGSDGGMFYVPESMWDKLKNQLFSVTAKWTYKIEVDDREEAHKRLLNCV